MAYRSKTERFRDVKKLGRIIRKHRKKKGWTQHDLAQRSGCDARQISRIELGTHEPRISMLYGVLRALGLDLAVTPDKPDRPRPPIEEIF
ncbi:helix-turn-helix domain-containing protein [Roseivivax lentus]|uniref:helix-turn-helix domain-containing protein n=1 Tax=Roseivivax lentus TaxID=633194 RepID=UPI000A028383